MLSIEVFRRFSINLRLLPGENPLRAAEISREIQVRPSIYA